MRNTSFRSTAVAVIALTITALALPSLAHAKRMGGGKAMPRSSMSKAPAATPAAPAAR